MPHKAGHEFFAHKREWSHRKDLILSYYLKPYLAKIARLNRPILIVDGFAGPGRFEDGNAGSPVLICQQAMEAVARGARVRVWCAEPNEELHGRLVANITQFSFAIARPQKFLSMIPAIMQEAAVCSVFLYLDPFTVEGIEWAALDEVFSHIQTSHSSVEVLLNLNVASFVRRGLAALSLGMTAPPEGERAEEESGERETPVEKLNSIAGGVWWQDVLRNSDDFLDTVQTITDAFCQRLALRFKEVCRHSVKEKISHSVPKYVLVFGSRHPDALLLMNEAMIKSRERFAESAPQEGNLFETRPLEVVPDVSRLPELIHVHAEHPITRKMLTMKVVRAAFCDYSETQIRQAIKALFSKGLLSSGIGVTKLTDQSLLQSTRKK